MHFPRMLGWAETQTLRLATLQMCELMDFTVYKQVPKGTRKMKMLSRNFILVSTAQKVPARISKQPPPFYRHDKQQAVPGLVPSAGATRRLQRSRPGPSFLDDSAPAERRGAVGPARPANGQAGQGRAACPRAPQPGAGVTAPAGPCPGAGYEESRATDSKVLKRGKRGRRWSRSRKTCEASHG